MEKLKRPIKNILPDFIKYKKSLGYKYDNTDKYYKLEKLLSKNNILFLKQLNENLLLNPEFKNYKNELKELIKFSFILANKTTPVKNNLKINRSNKYIPFIIDEDLFERICKYIDETSKYEIGNYKYIYPVLYRLLYSTGIRINEAMSLKIGDLDMSDNKIIINNSKNNKSRVIVVSDSMCDILKKYILLVKPTNYLFEYKHNKINYSTLQKHLKNICDYFDIKITFHDFRHSMATNSFKKLLSKKYKETEILYYLHCYLGHASINETEYYFYFNNIIKDSMVVNHER